MFESHFKRIAQHSGKFPSCQEFDKNIATTQSCTVRIHTSKLKQQRMRFFAHMFATHALCMTGISQEHLPFTFSLRLSSLVQNQLNITIPAPESTWQSMYV